jgi:dTDP-4-amino-4,6-dideoxygalactose transaminase
MTESLKPRIIGGMFGLDRDLFFRDVLPPFLNQKEIFLVDARSGIFLVCEMLKPGTVWLPSYLCEVMLTPLEKANMHVRFYEVNYNLQLRSNNWISEVEQGDLVIFIAYFGFPCDDVGASLAKGKGAWILEDACQALFIEDVGKFSDFVLFSPRKFLGVPDGGILVINRGIEKEKINLESPPAEWWLKTLRSTLLRREFDISGGSREWFDLFQETGIGAPIGRYAMSELSRVLLLHGFDYAAIRDRRIQNYRTLLDQLGNLAMFPHLPAKVVPLGFPIRLRNRDQVRQQLFDHEIYPPVHWPIEGIVPEEFRESHQLAADIMTLPCDQRYGSQDMKKMAKVVLEGTEI